MPQVSVIIPVYNAEKTLCRAIDSVLSQTVSDWELILVNDGSLDQSGEICDKYALRDKRIRVFHKENEGVAMARQLGVDMASGEYSIHLDSDDWIDPVMLEHMLGCIQANAADVLVVDFFETHSDGTENVKEQHLSGESANDLLHDIFKGRVFGALWHKLVRHSLYSTYNASFFKGINYCEDVLIWAQILRHDEVKICYLNESFYHYWVNVDSITHTMTTDNYKVLLKYKEKLCQVLPEKPYQEIRERVCLGLFQGGFHGGHLTQREIYRGLWENRFSIFKYNRSGSWFLCFTLMALGLSSLAHKFCK